MLANIGGPAPNKLDFLSVEHVICAKDREEGFIQKARQTVALSVWGGKIVCRTRNFWSECVVLCHRRRIDLKDKAKVVAYAWGAEFLPR